MTLAQATLASSRRCVVNEVITVDSLAIMKRMAGGNAPESNRPTVVLQLSASWPRSLLSRIHKVAPDAGRALRSRVALPIVTSALVLGLVSVLLAVVAASLQRMTAGSDEAAVGRVASGSSATLLKNLDSALVSAPWVSCERHRHASSPAHEPVRHDHSHLLLLPTAAVTDAESYSSYTKSVAHAAVGSPAAASVVRVEVVADAPPRDVFDAFVKPELTKKWNSFVGESVQLGNGVQLQSYKFPWPFVPREYLVRCTDQKLDGSGFRSHCASVDGHPKAPKRDDRVRGMSETLWQFTPLAGEPDKTVILFEGIVDPRGNIPKRVINEIGKRTCVTTALALARVAGEGRPGKRADKQKQKRR